MLVHHIESFPRFLARVMEITPAKAQAFIQECWGKDLLALDYAALRELSGDVVRPVVKELGIELPLIAWTRKVMPALALLSERVLTCKGCGELGIRLVGASWQALPEGQCSFCKRDILVRPEVEQAPPNWITGQSLEPGLTEVSVDGVMIPLLAEGVRPAIAILFGEEHDVDDQFAPYPILHVLNVLLNKGFQQIRSPREALRALVFPMQFDLLLPDVQRVIDHIQRGEWLTGYGPRRSPQSASVLPTAAQGDDEFNMIVALAAGDYPRDQALRSWAVADAHERGRLLDDVLKALAMRYGQHDKVAYLCRRAGLQIAIPDVSDPRQRWSMVRDRRKPGRRPNVLDGGGFDKLVHQALRKFPHNKVLTNWVNSPERPAAIGSRRIVPHILREEMASLYSSETSARLMLAAAGYPPSSIPTMSVPMHFWYAVFDDIANGIL